MRSAWAWSRWTLTPRQPWRARVSWRLTRSRSIKSSALPGLVSSSSSTSKLMGFAPSRRPSGADGGGGPGGGVGEVGVVERGGPAGELEERPVGVTEVQRPDEDVAVVGDRVVVGLVAA